MRAPSLAQTQHLLWRLITAPRGVADGLVAIGGADGLLAEGLDGLVNGDVVLPAVRRLDIYANMYFFRLLDALAEDYPTLRAVVGAHEFHNLITDYLLTHPPSHPSLRYAGQDLPAFVRNHRLSESHPYSEDLACFEWSLVEAFDAPDAAAIEASALAAIPAEAWADLRFQLTPSVHLLALNWPVADLWRRVETGEPPRDAAEREHSVRIWRNDLRVLHREIEADEFAALNAAAVGEPFAALCETVAEHVGSTDAATRAVELLHQWLADGLIVDASSSPRPR